MNQQRFESPQAPKLILDHVYDHAAQSPERIFLTQPIGGREVVDFTWAEVVDQASRMAAHLQARGMHRGDRIALLSANCAHFIMAELAIWMAGGTTVAIFPNEAPRTVRYVLEHSDSRLLFIGKLDTWERQRQAIPPEMDCIALPQAPVTPFETWEAIIGRTAPQNQRTNRAPGDLAFICYTSGSTGEPKGVMHSFERVSDTSERVVAYLTGIFGTEVQGRTLSYLPLAHIFERVWVECASLVDGRGQLYFTDLPTTFAQDLARARPTGFISVPRLWLKFQEAVHARMPAEVLDRLLEDPNSGPVVAREVLKGMGLDQVMSASSGSAPIPPGLIRWYRRLGLNLLEGYGMTEDMAYSHSSTRDLNEPGYVGVPLPGVVVRIAEDGEILIKSPGQMVGYYKRPDLDAQVFTTDGFFRTGDKGERRPDGLLRITGRLKEIFKTSKGKYVSPAPIENRLNLHPLVDAAMVGGAGQPAPYGLVVLSEESRARLDNGPGRAHVEAQMQQLLEETNQELAPHERMAMIVLCNEPWTIENGCLTPTLKIKRARIEALYSHLVPTWYAAQHTVTWATT